VEADIGKDLMKHWTLLHALQLNGRTVFNSKLILMLRVFFRSFLDIWTQARVWAWFLKPVSILTQFKTVGLLQNDILRDS